MASTLTTTILLKWINASTSSSVSIAATPDSETLALMEQCIDAAINSVEAYCSVPDVYPVAVEQAVLMLASRLWDRRKTPNGISMGDFGVVRVGSYDADIEALLAPYRNWNFG